MPAVIKVVFVFTLFVVFYRFTRSLLRQLTNHYKSHVGFDCFFFLPLVFLHNWIVIFNETQWIGYTEK
uniref:Uncharacterized protein n=1 Tax=Panstrongylus lignarius TaxID=156445 RepID=A0A224Y6X2_9HEMI